MSDREQFIDKLDRACRSLEEIFKADSDNYLIQGDERTALRALQTANKKILNKLKSREFTVAIVGLEKAGKSTVGNALIKSMVLPEYRVRCTYTTTEIRAGNTDVAEVYFYTREEFNENFKRMLRDLQYPDEADFESMSLDTFLRYWKTVEGDSNKFTLFNTHNGSTAEDITTILEGKQKILPLLGQPRKEFGAEYWNSDDTFNEFKTYITGMAGQNDDGTIKREPNPYAVKNVIIRSTQLADMSHIVLYDVPGFDSPTELHKRQTEEMLKEADAIIFVTNAADRPNLVDTQLSMLRKGHDADGVKLRDKAFVFGNKIDRAPDAKTAGDNFAELRHEAVDKYQITLDTRTIGGSARAYLEKIGLFKEKIASPILDGWQMDDGIEDLRGKMQEYYDNDRYAVLKRRAESTLDKTRKRLEALLERCGSDDLSYLGEGAEIVMEVQARLPQFIKAAYGITREHTKKIAEERPFTNALKNDVNNIFPLVAEAHAQLIEDEERGLAIDPDGVYPTNKVNGLVRDKLGVLFIENIVTSAAKFTAESRLELRRALVDSFLDIMGVEAATEHRAALDESVNKLFDKMLIVGGAECNFNSLVERFAMTPIQTLITHPFAEAERCQKVKEALYELVSLSVYYNMPADKNGKNSLRLEDLVGNGNEFFARILAHENFRVEYSTEKVDEPAVNAAEVAANEQFLRGLFDANSAQIHRGARVNLSSAPFGQWAKTIHAADRPKIKATLENLLYARAWATYSAGQKMKYINELFDTFAKQNSTQVKANVVSNPVGTRQKNPGGALFSQLDEIQERAKKSKRMDGKDDMIATLDADILILRDITARAVINAIGLERAFNSVIIKNVDLIRKHLREEEGNEAFRAWIRTNAAKLMPARFEQIIAQSNLHEKRKTIVNAINHFLELK